MSFSLVITVGPSLIEKVSNCRARKQVKEGRNGTKKAKHHDVKDLIIILVLLEPITLIVLLLGKLLVRIEHGNVSRFLERRSSSCSWTGSRSRGDDRVVVVFVLIVRY